MVRTINLQNNKAQFFIASAVIAIISITAIIFYVSQAGQIDNPSIVSQDQTFFINNVKLEYMKVAETALSLYSNDDPSGPTAFSTGLASLTSLVNNLSSQKGTEFSSSYAINVNTNESMNATVNLSFISQGEKTDVNFYSVSEINVSIDSGTFTTSPACSFDFSVKKEYAEPIPFLNNTTAFTAKINGTNCAPAEFSHQGSGVYTATCSSQACVNSNVAMVVTDNRNIIGTNSTNS